MNRKLAKAMGLMTALAWGGVSAPALAVINVQCPGDDGSNGGVAGDAIIDTPDPAHPTAKCMHLAASDGFATMGDGNVLYTFGFSDVTGIDPSIVYNYAALGGTISAPTISVDEGDEFYLTLSNVGMVMRPDLFDPHSVHWHGFPQAAAVFDGEPESTLGVNMGESFTYYYKVNEPGTFLYHCHVEATEHMEMGMLGNLYVRPKQNKLPAGTDLNGFTHQDGFKYAYNDGDGSTYYDVEVPLQVSSFDREFHEQHIAVQALPFATLKTNYGMINGRGYPDTVNPAALPAPAENGGKASQLISSKVEAIAGQKVLLRLSNVSVTTYFTLTSPNITMKVVGQGAAILRGPTGKDLSYSTNSVTLGGGEAADVILDTTGIAPGRYFLYTTNLQYLSNDLEDRGGIMTEILINAPI